MKNKTLHNAFPIVAAAIGNRFGIKVSVGGDQAYTNGKAIQLPAYEGDDPDYQDYAWGLLAHEAAHIRYSDFSLNFGSSVLRRRLSGAIEDVRIEYELAKDFPGTRLTLRTVIEKMIAKGGFTSNASDAHPANILYGYVLISLRARVLGQVALNPLVEKTEIALKAKFPKGAVIRLKGLLSEVPDGLTSEADCLMLTDRILTMIEQEIEQEKQKNSNTQNEQPEPSTDEDNADDPSEQFDLSDSPNSDEAEIEQAYDSQDSESSDLSNQDQEIDLSSPDNDPVTNDESHSDSDDDVTDQDDSVEQNESEACSADTGESTTDIQNPNDPIEKSCQSYADSDVDDSDVEISDPSQVLEALMTANDNDIDQDVFDAIKSELALEQNSGAAQVMPLGNEPPLNEQAGLNLFTKVQSESVKIRAALQGMVQSQSLVRTKHSNRGQRIDGKRLHHLSLGDPKVFKRSTARVAPNTAIHLLLDKSESMSYSIVGRQGELLGTRMPIALEASLALALALEGLPGVNPGITAFPGSDYGTVYRLLEHGQHVRQRAGAFSLSASGSTPMTEAIWFAAGALLRCREPRKVLMVMTDGQPNDTVSTLEILQRCRDSGIETVGIGLGIDVSHLFPVSIAINELQELRTRLFELSKSVLLAA